MFVNKTFHGTTVENKNLNAMNIYFSFPYKHTLKHKFCTNRNIFHRDMKENASGCFCLMIRQKKHPLAFSFMSRWKMFRFKQNFQGVFVSNLAFHRSQNYIFIATADSQTFYQMCLSSFVKPVISQTCKYDARITSSVAMNI